MTLEERKARVGRKAVELQLWSMQTAEEFMKQYSLEVLEEFERMLEKMEKNLRNAKNGD